MRGFYQSYRRSPYSIIASRWRRHVIHLFAVIGVGAVAYAYVNWPGIAPWH